MAGYCFADSLATAPHAFFSAPLVTDKKHTSTIILERFEINISLIVWRIK